MKILLATPLFPPEIGGPGTHAKWASEELRKRGYVVRVMPFNLVKGLPKGVKHVVYFCKLAWHARKADCVYALDPVSVGLPAAVAALLMRKPLVLRVAGEYAWEQGVQRYGVKENLDQFVVSKKKYPFMVRVFKKIEMWVAKRAASIVVPSNYFKTIIETWGIASEKIHVVYSTLTPLAVPTKEEARASLGITAPLILSAGRLVPWKGFIGLIEAFTEVVKTYPEARLSIAGSGPDSKSIEDAIEAAGLQGLVRLEGMLSQQELARFVAAADVFALNTKYEGLSHQLIEVMQIGTPIVTTAVGGNVELIKNGVSGLLVQPDDTATLTASLLKILSSGPFGQVLAMGAKASLARFTPGESLQALVAVFEAI